MHIKVKKNEVDKEVIVESNQKKTVNFFLKSQPGIIFGNVCSQDLNLPIEKATVGVFKGEALIASQLTDSHGDFTFFSLPAESYIVRASTHDYQTVCHEANVLPNQRRKVLFKLASSPSSLIGQVRDGEPFFTSLGDQS